MKENLLEYLGLTPNDFEPNSIPVEDRIEAIEEAIIELAEMVVMNNG